MTSMNDICKNINDMEALEENIKIVLNTLPVNQRLKDLMMELRSSKISKNSEKSKNFRELGNRQYLKCDDPHRINTVIESFTKSIAYAPLGSTELSLAYANRSALLMKARLYDDALVDIRRALKAGYPDCLKAKLFLRRALCLKAVDTTAESDIEKALENTRGWLKRMDKKSPSRQIVRDALDDLNKMIPLPSPRIKWNARRFLNNVFEENPDIINASSSIAMKTMENDKTAIIATRDIKPGEIISTQEPYAALLQEHRRYTNCWHCHDQTLSAIPCHSCAHVVFCSETCRVAAWSDYHSIECQLLPVDSISPLTMAYCDIVIMRMLIRAVKDAGSIRGLKKITQTIESDPDVGRKSVTGSKFNGSKLSTLHGLPTYSGRHTPAEIRGPFYKCLIIAVSLATQSDFFGEEMTHQRFYQHELFPFVTAFLLRYRLITVGAVHGGCDIMESLEMMDRSLLIVPLHSYIAHSCAPNVSTSIFGLKTVIYAHYPIKRGEQIFQCRVSTFENNPKKDRQDRFRNIFGVPCCCVACTENWPDAHLPQCNVFRVPADLLFAHGMLLRTIDKRLELSMRGNFAVIAMLINDLSVIISDWWDHERPPSLELAQTSEFLNRIFFILGNRLELF